MRASNSKEALSRMRTDAPALAVVNSTSLHTDGLRICLDLKDATDNLCAFVRTSLTGRTS